MNKPEKRNEYHGKHYIINSKQILYVPYETSEMEERDDEEINEFVNATHNQLWDKFDKYHKHILTELADVLNLEALIMNKEVSILQRHTTSDTGLLEATSRKELAKEISEMIKEKIC